MPKIKLSKYYIKNKVKLALNEDLYPNGDITSSLVKHIYVSQTQIDQLSRGTLAIVTQKDGQKNNHVVVPMGVAKKIEQRDPKVVVFKAQQNTIGEEDDPYADFQIPDDMTW